MLTVARQRRIWQVPPGRGTCYPSWGPSWEQYANRLSVAQSRQARAGPADRARDRARDRDSSQEMVSAALLTCSNSPTSRRSETRACRARGAGPAKGPAKGPAGRSSHAAAALPSGDGA